MRENRSKQSSICRESEKAKLETQVGKKEN